MRVGLGPILAAAGAVTGGILCSELAHAGAARRVPRGDGARRAVIVLGYPSTRRGTPNAIQRWRAQIGARTLARAGDGLLIFTGCPTRGRAESEAAVMARYAVDVLGVPEAQVRVEELARSTWENVELSLLLAEHAEQIAFASDPLHAARARGYLTKQRPDLTERLVGAVDYRVLERWWLKGPCLAYEMWIAARHAVWLRRQATI